MATKKIVVSCLNKFYELFPTREITKGLIDIWVEAFKGELDNNFEIACKYAIKKCKFFPVPADIQKELEGIVSRITINLKGKKMRDGVPYVG